MNQRSVLLLAFAAVVGCTRPEPGSGVVAPPTVEPLTEIAVYETGVPEPSGLAYHWRNGTLLTVSDGNSTVYEMTLTGSVLRSMVIQSSDLEGIVLSANCDTMVVAEETNRLVTTYLSDGTKLSSFPVNVATNGGNALEGVALDGANHLFVLNEKAPRLLLEFSGGTEIRRTELTYTTDCSDIVHDPSGDCFWMVSDESMAVVRLSRAGGMLGQWRIPFSKGEGIAIVEQKIYIVSDADGKLHVFQKPA